MSCIYLHLTYFALFVESSIKEFYDLVQVSFTKEPYVHSIIFVQFLPTSVLKRAMDIINSCLFKTIFRLKQGKQIFWLNIRIQYYLGGGGEGYEKTESV